MVRIKYVDADLLPRMPKVWWFGYGAEFAAQMHAFIDFLFAPAIAKRLSGGLRSVKAFFRTRRI